MFDDANSPWIEKKKKKKKNTENNERNSPKNYIESEVKKATTK